MTNQPDIFSNSDLEKNNSLAFYRTILLVAAAVYISWWFVVDQMMPDSYNPFVSRLLISLLLLVVATATYFSQSMRKHIEYWFLFCAWVGTTHFYYLFYNNRLSAAWEWACYLVIVAVSATMQTMRSLVSYMFIVLVLSTIINQQSPTLKGTVFLPGVITILLFAFISLKSRLRLTAQVREAGLQTRRILDAMFEGMALHDGQFILDANQAMANMFGYSRHELIGRNLYTLTASQSKELVANHVYEKSEAAYEVFGVRKDGTTFPIEVRGKQHILPNGKIGRIVAIQNITDRKKNEQTKILFEASQEALRIRDEFISIASHELKTPLTSIKLQTQMVKLSEAKGDSATYSEEKMRKFVQQVDRQADRLAKLIENMLDVSRISLGKLILEKKPTDMNVVVNEAIDSLSDVIKQSGSTLTKNIEADVVAHVDQFRIEQVITNLLTNAIKYGEGKNISIELKKNNLSGFVFSISDQGMGIAIENHERIFARFERAVAAKKISGLGLGLYITQQIVQAHNGTISVKSAPNEGACFTVSIP